MGLRYTLSYTVRPIQGVAVLPGFESVSHPLPVALRVQAGHRIQDGAEDGGEEGADG